MFLEGGQASELESVLIANSGLRHAVTALVPDALATRPASGSSGTSSPTIGCRGCARRHAQLGRTSCSSTFRARTFRFSLTARAARSTIGRSSSPVAGRQPCAAAAELDAAADRYSAQLAYVDGLAIEALDEVIAGVPPDAVIVVMGDHGPDAYIDWDHLETTPTLERFATLFAARTPGFDHLFGDGPTPVNLIPTLLNSYAGPTLPMHSDDSFRGYPPRQASDIVNP